MEGERDIYGFEFPRSSEVTSKTASETFTETRLNQTAGVSIKLDQELGSGLLDSIPTFHNGGVEWILPSAPLL